MSHIRRIAHQNKTMLLKTASYYVIPHLRGCHGGLRRHGQFARVAHAELAGTQVQAVAFFFHEKAWARKQNAPVAQTCPSGCLTTAEHHHDTRPLE